MSVRYTFAQHQFGAKIFIKVATIIVATKLSPSALAALLVLAFLGGGAIEDFALTMFIGILVGTYSSIYVAAPLTLVMDDFLQKRGWKPKDRAQLAKVVKDPNYIPPVVLKKRVTKEG